MLKASSCQRPKSTLKSPMLSQLTAVSVTAGWEVEIRLQAMNRQRQDKTSAHGPNGNQAAQVLAAQGK